MFPETRYALDRDGNRYGPYTVAELQTYVAQGYVEPGDMVTTDGMSNWVPVSVVLARVQAEPFPPQPVSPQQPQRADSQRWSDGGQGSAAATKRPSEFERLFTMEGRMNRARYFWTSVAINFAVLVATFIVGALLGGLSVASNGDPENASVAASVIGALMGIGGMVLAALQTVKRLHDIDRPGSHYWLLLVPFYNIYIACLLLFKKGTEGPNRFGSDPLGPQGRVALAH